VSDENAVSLIILNAGNVTFVFSSCP
jgi:hypothetical protein